MLVLDKPTQAVSIMSADFYNEMYDPAGTLRPHYSAFADWLATMPAERLERKRAEADTAFHRVGITFAVYGEEAGTERPNPLRHHPTYHSRGGVAGPADRSVAKGEGA
jgi:uncharacterized circularly permuted ATP-grasp superfamily protein